MSGRLSNFSKTLTGTSIVYLFATGLEALVPMLLMPLLTRTLHPDQYGFWVLFVGLSSFLHPILSLGLQDAIRMKYFSLGRDGVGKFIANAMVSCLIAAIVVEVVVLFTSRQLQILTTFPSEWMWSIVGVAYLYGLFYTLLAVLQFQENRSAYVSMQFLQAVTTILFAVGFVAIGWGWQGVIFARMTGLVTANIVGLKLYLPELITNLRVNIRSRHLTEAFMFGIRYMPMCVLPVIIPLTDRLFVTHKMNAAETGYFGIGASFSQVLWLFVIAFNYAWQPSLFRAYAQPNLPPNPSIRKVSVVYLISLPAAGFFVWFGSTLVGDIFISPQYHQAYRYIGWMTLAVVCQGYFQLSQSFLQATQMIKSMSAIALCAIVLNVCFNYLWIDSYGGAGVALGTAASFLISAIVALVTLKIGRSQRLGRSTSIIENFDHRAAKKTA